MRKISRPHVVGAGLLAAAVIGAAGPVQSALAYISPPLVLLASTQGTGTLVAKGAAVDVPINYTCTGNMDVQLGVTEAVGRRTASGWGYISVPCDGRSRNTTVRVSAQAGGASFGTGTAAVDIQVWGWVCSRTRCYYGDDTFKSTIKITK